ncbi:hypothetical protein D9757_002671 [Collybiopsis confluens]|uniref:Uncharacterized protein n=1 Tax=Collybiopsis confluens TaxID=2823264 RepID=A0A8H5HW70_9AGAR|nr:hypothetical protein D9757_002671 [Collybiopsis confluens]
MVPCQPLQLARVRLFSFKASKGLYSSSRSQDADHSKGVFVQVFGTIPSSDSLAQVSSYTLDNSSSVSFSPMNETQYGGHRKDQTQQHDHPNQIFYQASGLSSANHTLVINYTQPVGLLTLGSIVSGPTSSPSNSATASLFPSLSTPTSSSAFAVAQKPFIGAIVGGVLAALFLIASILAFFLLRRRRNRRIQNDKHRAVTPFIPERITRQSRAHSLQRDPYAAGMSAPIDLSDEKTSFPTSTFAHISRHGSLYKPKFDTNDLPSPVSGYGGGV